MSIQVSFTLNISNEDRAGSAITNIHVTEDVPNGTDRDFVLNLRNTNRVRGGDDCEFIAPIHEGDTLTAQTKLLSIVHRKGSTGDLVITTFETRYTNQRGMSPPVRIPPSVMMLT